MVINEPVDRRQPGRNHGNRVSIPGCWMDGSPTDFMAAPFSSWMLAGTHSRSISVSIRESSRVGASSSSPPSLVIHPSILLQRPRWRVEASPLLSPDAELQGRRARLPSTSAGSV